VTSIIGDIYASSAAISPTRWADADAIGAVFAIGALIIAFSAVIGVGGCIYADIRADDLTRRARYYTDTIGADLTRSAFFSATTAIIWICVEIDTSIIAYRLTGWA
jgi:O-antigen/teichoic acid export membrane protein